ncbi:MAG: Spy/CpxP family protein refolding chaperone [Verrucomicrobiia bacterium]
MRQWLTIVAVMALLTASGVRAQDQPPAPRRGGRGGFMQNIGSVLPQSVVDQLSLTADQQAKLKDLDAKFIKERDQLLEKQKAATNDIAKVRADMTAARDAGDQAKVGELRGKLQELMQPQQDLQKKYQDEFRKSLTDEQKKKLDDALQQMANRRGGGRRGGPGGPPPPPPGGGN